MPNKRLSLKELVMHKKAAEFAQVAANFGLSSNFVPFDNCVFPLIDLLPLPSYVLFLGSPRLPKKKLDHVIEDDEKDIISKSLYFYDSDSK